MSAGSDPAADRLRVLPRPVPGLRLCRDCYARAGETMLAALESEAGIRNAATRTLTRSGGSYNLERIKQWFEQHLCGTQRECATELELSVATVNKYVRLIREEWRD